MIIPCIDLQEGKVVQLVQGEDKVLEDDYDSCLKRFDGFDLIHIIDLDAAKSRGNNDHVYHASLRHLKARVGGGIRTVADAVNLLAKGAHQVIIGSAAMDREGVQHTFLGDLCRAVTPDRVLIALDMKRARIAVNGWRQTLDWNPLSVMPELGPYCAGYLCTCVDREGLMGGTDIEWFRTLRQSTDKTIVAAGGISSLEEVDSLVGMGCQVALGMSLYTGKLPIGELMNRNKT